MAWKVTFMMCHEKCSLRKDAPRNFAKFTGKHLCQSFVFNKVAGLLQKCSERYPDNCPPVRVGVWIKVRVSFRVGGQPDNWPREKLPPEVRVGVWPRVSFGVGGQFSSGPIVLEPFWKEWTGIPLKTMEISREEKIRNPLFSNTLQHPAALHHGGSFLIFEG